MMSKFKAYDAHFRPTPHLAQSNQQKMCKTSRSASQITILHALRISNEYPSYVNHPWNIPCVDFIHFCMTHIKTSRNIFLSGCNIGTHIFGPGKMANLVSMHKPQWGFPMVICFIPNSWITYWCLVYTLSKTNISLGYWKKL